MMARLYPILTTLTTPLAFLFLAFRVLTGKDSQCQAKNRYGIATKSKQGPVIWLHAASVGELQSVKPLLLFLNKQHPNYQILVTTNNPTALQLADGWLNLSLTTQAAPLDIGAIIHRFLDHWKPVAFINIEGEFWPNRFAILAEGEIPAVFINTRISQRSAERLIGFSLGQTMKQNVKMFYCQDDQTAGNLLTLGVPAARIDVIQNLKALVGNNDKQPDLGAFQDVFDYTKTLLAASTHKGEDEIILSAFAKVRKTIPDLKLIIAPRHPKRVNTIARLISETGFTAERRSEQQTPSGQPDVLIVDTLGEMQVFYQLAAITIVAGSFVPKGGHTPYEPLHHQSAIITGPYVENFSSEFAALAAAGGCLLVQNDDDLAEAIISLTNTGARENQLEHAAGVFQTNIDPETLYAQLVKPLNLLSSGAS